MHVNHHSHSGSYISLRSALLFILYDGSLPLVSFTSSVFHVFIHAYFTCIWVVILNCGNGLISAFCDAVMVVFFFERDRVTVDRELQGSYCARNYEKNCKFRYSLKGKMTFPLFLATFC